MNSLSSVSRLAVRTVGARALAAPAVRHCTSMKQPFDLTTGDGRGGMVPNSAAYQKVREMQTKFHENPHLLVHEKLGTKDKIPYQFALLLCVVTALFLGRYYYIMSFPQKRD